MNHNLMIMKEKKNETLARRSTRKNISVYRMMETTEIEELRSDRKTPYPTLTRWNAKRCFSESKDFSYYTLFLHCVSANLGLDDYQGQLPQPVQ